MREVASGLLVMGAGVGVGVGIRVGSLLLLFSTYKYMKRKEECRRRSFSAVSSAVMGVLTYLLFLSSSSLTEHILAVLRA